MTAVVSALITITATTAATRARADPTRDQASPRTTTTRKTHRGEEEVIIAARSAPISEAKTTKTTKSLIITTAVGQTTSESGTMADVAAPDTTIVPLPMHPLPGPITRTTGRMPTMPPSVAAVPVGTKIVTTRLRTARITTVTTRRIRVAIWAPEKAIRVAAGRGTTREAPLKTAEAVDLSPLYPAPIAQLTIDAVAGTIQRRNPMVITKGITIITN